MTKKAPILAIVVSLLQKERLDIFMEDWSLDVVLRVYPGVIDPNPANGCYLAHRNLLASTNEPVLVLEDDAIFSPDFTLDLPYPDDCDLFYLGGEHVASPRKTTTPGIVVPRRIRRTHAYITWEPQRIAAALPPIPTKHIDYALLDLPLRRYAVCPFTVGQRAGYSTIRGGWRNEHWWNS
jgi:hypothetical protein